MFSFLIDSARFQSFPLSEKKNPMEKKPGISNGVLIAKPCKVLLSRGSAGIGVGKSGCGPCSPRLPLAQELPVC